MQSLSDGLAQIEDSRVLLHALLFLGGSDLGQIACVDRHRNSLGDLVDNAWCHLCSVEWASKSPRYTLTTERAMELTKAFPGRPWREHFRHAMLDGRRKELHPEELQSLRWAFNFTPLAGGVGKGSMQFVEFRPQNEGSSQGVLLMQRYPPLPYKLSSDGKVLLIADFPPHYIERLDSWEWVITNQNVTFVSCVGDDVRYTQRGFLEVNRKDLVDTLLHRILQLGAEP